MKWLPYESWEVQSPLSADGLVRGMTKRIGPAKWFGWARAHTPLQGQVHAGGFLVSRVIAYRNSFLPCIHGTFIPSDRGTTIRIRMMPHIVVIVFMACWFGMLGLFGLVGLFVLIAEGNWILLLVCGGMGAFALLLVYGGFWAEAGKAKDLLSQVLLEVHSEAVNNSVQGGEGEPLPLPRG
jgi:hypothetical protein